MGGGGSSSKASSAKAGGSATNARNIENMNEAQLDNEIARTKSKIQSLESSMRQNLAQSGYSQAMQEAFPIGAGGDGWSRAGRARQEKERTSSLKKAAAFVKERDQKKSAEKRLSELQKAKKQVSSTGKTQSQLSKAAKTAAAKSSDALKWKTTNKGGYTSDGGYASREISAGNYKIRGSSGFFRVYDGSKQIGGAQKLSDAKALVEIWRKKKR